MDDSREPIKATVILVVNHLELPIYHHNKRLYKFVDWKSAEPLLAKIVSDKLWEDKQIKGVIKFEKVIPMRKGRMSNFFLALEFVVTTESGVIIYTSDELEFTRVFVDRFIELDPVEIQNRKNVEEKHAIEQYLNEYKIRRRAIDTLCLKGIVEFDTNDEIKEFLDTVMEAEGWDRAKDNRPHVRAARVFPLENR